MNQTSRHGMPLLASGQAQKEVTHNEALNVIDRRMQMSVVSRRLAAPPEPVTTGAAFIVPADATGAWAGQQNRIASFDGFGWTFDEPRAGWLAWIEDEGVLGVFDAGWSAGAWPVTSLRIGGRVVLGAEAATVSAPAGGAAIDLESRRAIEEILAALRVQGLIQ